MTKILAVVALLCLATPALAEEAKPAAKKAKAPMAMTPADLKWTDVPRMKGLQSATVWGDPEKSAHGRFIKFAGGTDNPLHKHTNDLRSVVVSGTFYVGADAASAKDLPAGSASFTPGGWNHVSGCRAGADCVIYSESTAKFDFIPAEKAAEAKK